MDFSAAELYVKKIKVGHRFVMKAPGSTGFRDGRGCFGIVFCLGGDVRFSFKSGRELKLSQGEAVLFVPHAAYTTHVRGEFSHYTVNFDGEVTSHFDMSDDGFLHVSVGESELFRHRLERLIELLRRDTDSPMLALGALYTVLGMFFGELRRQHLPSARYAELESVKRYIDESFDGSFSIEELSRMARMSRTAFVREWKRVYSVTPFEYRDALRMELARRELLDGEFSIGEVAEHCGFSDPAYFIRFFKKREGRTPGVYRREPMI